MVIRLLGYEDHGVVISWDTWGLLDLLGYLGSDWVIGQGGC